MKIKWAPSQWPLLKRLPHSHYALLSLLYIVGLELVFLIHRWPYLLGSTFLVILIAGVALLRWEEKHNFDVSQSILPILSIVGLTSFMLFIQVNAFIHLYFLVAGGVFFLVLRYGARAAYPSWNWSLSTLVLFLCTASLIGWRLYAFSSLTLVLCLLGIIYWLISWQALVHSVPHRSTALLLAFNLSLMLTELVWILQFLPLGHIAEASLLTIAYYTGFNIISLSFHRPLTRRDAVEYTTVAMISLLIICFSTQWV